MVEALAAGTPVLAVDRGGARDIVRRDRDGVLISNGADMSQIRAGVRELAERDWSADELRAGAQRFSEERFRKRLAEVLRARSPLPRAGGSANRHLRPQRRSELSAAQGRPAGITQRRQDRRTPRRLLGQRQVGARKDALRRRLLFFSYVLCFLVAVAAMALVEGTTDPLWAVVTLPLWILVAKLEDLYDADHPKIWHLTLDEAQGIFHWITLSVAATLFFIRALE